MTTCPPCLLTQAERKAVATMRHLEMVARKGGKVVAYIDKEGRWQVRETVNR